jgi:soluble lytic murein transglycosylase-like protein
VPQRSPGRADAAGQARIRALAPLMADVAQRHGIDPLLLHALAHIESRHQAQAISPAGARGVMQVMPATGRDMGVAQAAELLTPQANVEASARYLKRLQGRFGNDLRLVLAAYNAGEGAVERHGRRVPPFAETQAYVRNVLAVYDVLRRRLAGGQA